MNIFVAGHNGMVGASLIKEIALNHKNKSINIITRDRSELDLVNQEEVTNFFQNENIDHVVICAARVGGINANNIFPANFIYDNLMIQSNIIHNAFLSDVKKLIFLGSSCIYPKHANQPIKESYLLNGPLEKTNEAYAIAKITGVKMCDSYNKQYGTDFRSLMPTNLYGPNDNFSLDNSHVLPALITKFHQAKITNQPYMQVWGSTSLREFMHVDDLSAIMFVLNSSKKDYLNLLDEGSSHINVGSGEEISIKDLSILIKDIIKYKGEIKFDSSMPDGTPRKLMNSDSIKGLGWEANISLEKGIKETYEWYLKNELN